MRIVVTNMSERKLKITYELIYELERTVESRFHSDIYIGEELKPRDIREVKIYVEEVKD